MKEEANEVVIEETPSDEVYSVSQLKQDLDAWKYLLLPINNLLEWRSQHDPLIILSVNTLVFILLTYYSPSILTTVSVIGLFCLFVESVVPLASSYLFKSVEWSADSEARYTRICQRISNFHQHLVAFKNKLLNTRKQRQSLYFLIVFFFLIFCAYVGQHVDNSFLTYLIVQAITMTPGARKHRVIEKLSKRIKSSLGMGRGAKQSTD